ncbi:tyrosine-type recombinase/integrase, partial [Escherichia coli]
EDVERFPELKRERFLSPNELQRLGQALTAAEVHQTETKYAVAAFRILLLTGCRLSEIQRLEWRHVDLQQKEL